MLFAVHCDDNQLKFMHNDTTIYSFHIAPGSRSKFILKIDGDHAEMRMRSRLQLTMRLGLQLFHQLRRAITG